jgi:hypothetical protein
MHRTKELRLACGDDVTVGTDVIDRSVSRRSKKLRHTPRRG